MRLSVLQRHRLAQCAARTDQDAEFKLVIQFLRGAEGRCGIGSGATLPIRAHAGVSASNQ